MKQNILKTAPHLQKAALSKQQCSVIKGGNADLDPEVTTIIYDSGDE